MAVKAACSARIGLAQLFVEQLADLSGREVHGGRDDVDRPLLGKLHDVFAQIGLDGPDAGLFQDMVQLHLLGDHRLRLHHALDVVLPRDLQHEAVGFRRILGEKDLDAAGLHGALELHQQLVEIGDRILLDLVGGLAPVLEIRNRRGHGRVALAGVLADLAQVLEPRRRLVEALVLVFQERCTVEMAGMFGH